MAAEEAEALSEQMEDVRPSTRKKPTKPKRPAYRWFRIQYSGWGGEYKSCCNLCDYQSGYGTRGKAVKSAVAHVGAKHPLLIGDELR